MIILEKYIDAEYKFKFISYFEKMTFITCALLFGYIITNKNSSYNKISKKGYSMLDNKK